MKSTGSVIVSWDFSNGEDKSILLVGEKKPNQTFEIINAYQGKEARELHQKLTKKKYEQLLMGGE